jgi:hypothetical protein
MLTTRRRAKWTYYGINPKELHVLDAIFKHHEAALQADRRLIRDAERVRLRLTLREEGSCNLGYNQIASLENGGEKKCEC